MKHSIRFITTLILALAMSAMLAMASYATDPATLVVGTAQVTANANVRTGPSTQHSVVGHMSQGTLVAVIDFQPQNGFIKVSYEGSVRYVSNSLLKVVPTQPIQKTPVQAPSPEPQKPQANAIIDRVTITVDMLNVRNGPGKQYPIVGKLARGAVVPIINYYAGNGYALVSYEGTVRYAYVDGYSTRVSTSTQTPTQTPVTAPGTARVTASVLNVRFGPGTQYDVVGKLTQNQVVSVINYDVGNGFAKISYRGAVRYVALQYLGW